MNKTVQRVIIWMIALAMIFGTMGAFFAIILANNNSADQQRELAQAQAELQRQQQACQAVAVPEGVSYDKPDAVTFDKESVNELRVEDIEQGTGEEVTSVNDCVTVHYLGNLSDGTVFDNSYDRGAPIAFTLSNVIEGWQEGLIGMKEGDVRQMFIPSELAYKERGNVGIGPNEPLFFQIELIDVQ